MEVIGCNTRRFKKQLDTPNEEGMPVTCKEFDNPREEYMCVVAALKKRMERGEDLLNTAILLRTNQESEGLINVLMEYQVPFTMKEQLPNLFRHWICRALLAYLEMAAGDRSRKNFLEIMNRPNRYISREALNSSQINFNELREYYKDKDWMCDRITTLETHLRILGTLSPFIDGKHLRDFYTVGIRIKIGKVAEHIARRVADLSVCVRKLFEDFRGDADIGMVVGRSDPQTQDICAVLIHNLLRQNAVAEGLTHLSALTVHDPAVCDDSLVRRFAAPCNGREQRRLEPAAVLVCTLKVQVSRPMEIIACIANGSMGHAGIKPNVHDVALFCKGGAAALLALCACGQNFFRFLDVPSIGALCAEQLGNCVHRVLLDERLAAVLAVENRNRHTPATLTGDTPVIAVTDHGGNAVFAPARDPLYALDGFNRLILDSVFRLSLHVSLVLQ